MCRPILARACCPGTLHRAFCLRRAVFRVCSRIVAKRTVSRAKRKQIKHRATRRAVVLLSGGVDSAVCLALLRRDAIDVESLFIDYGQSSSKAELSSARRVARRFKSPLSVVHVGGFAVNVGEIRARNLLLLACAANRAIANHHLIVIGVHSGTPYADCGEPFVKEVQDVLDVYTAGCVSLCCPLLHLTKMQVYTLAHELDLDISSLHSCERGDVPCGKCRSCQDRSVVEIK